MADGTTFKIDGRDVLAKPGQTILQAALDQEIYIPYLCYYPKMKPVGSCRACMVEVEANGRTMTVASCTTPPMPDSEVTTNSLEIKELRKDVLELLMTEHPHGCLTCHRIELCGPQDICQRHVTVTDRCTICPKNERCELKDTVRLVELDLRTPLNYHRRDLQTTLPPAAAKNQTISIGQFCEVLSISRHTAYKLRDSHQVRMINVSIHDDQPTYRIQITEVERFINSRQTMPQKRSKKLPRVNRFG